MNFKQWLEDAGITHDDYVNKGPYIAHGLRSKYRTDEDPKYPNPHERAERKRMKKTLNKFGQIDPKLRQGFSGIEA